MNGSRRRALRAGGGLGLLAALVATGLIRPEVARAQAGSWNKAAFEGKSLQDVVKAFGGSAPVESREIAITAPEIAENGAVVPISVTSRLARTEAIAILVEKNPNALAASFALPAGTEGMVGTRVKMGQTSNVHALVKADGKYYVATKEVKVTIGGCGG